jgi:glycosyltransferase involved in cell wall biosynthesis
MRVGVDATAFGNRHGDGRFARNAVRRLVQLDGESDYVLLVDRSQPACRDLTFGAELRPLPLGRGSSARSMRPPVDLLRLTAAALTGYDSLLFPSLVSWFPALGAPSVVGVHDANVARFGPVILPTRRGRAAWRLKQTIALRSAARLFTVSEAARGELARHVGLPAERLEVVPQAPDPVFRPREEAAARRATVALGPATAGDFVLYASGINPHKSVETLVDACAALIAAGRSCPPLVLVGPLEEDSANSAAGLVRARIDRLGLADRVLLPGFVDDETLAALYSTATVAVVTSRGEGFGLPAVEAAACGAPVVLSDIPAHRETLDGAARFFPTGESGALAQALSELLDDGALRRDLAERGRRRVARLSWDRSAHVLRRLVAEAAVNEGGRPAARRRSRRARGRP